MNREVWIVVDFDGSPIPHTIDARRHPTNKDRDVATMSEYWWTKLPHKASFDQVNEAEAYLVITDISPTPRPAGHATPSRVIYRIDGEISDDNLMFLMLKHNATLSQPRMM